MFRRPQIVEKCVARTRLDNASSKLIKSDRDACRRQWSFGDGGAKFEVALETALTNNCIGVYVSIRHCSDSDSTMSTIIVMKRDDREVLFGPASFNVNKNFVIFRQVNADYFLVARDLLKGEEITVEVMFEQPVSSESAHDAGSTNLQMLHDTSLADCIFKIGGDEIKAHRCILAQRSEVFRAMFSQESTHEAKNGVIKIKDSDCVSVNAMLEYMYSGTVELTDENVEGVIILADKYAVTSLIEGCSDYLAGKLDDTNVIRTAVLGDLCSSSAILKKCGDYLKKNRPALFDTDEWKELESTNQTLAMRLLQLSY